MSRDQKHPDIKILKEERVYDGFLKIDRIMLSHDRFDGAHSGELPRELMQRGNAVGVLPYDPNTGNVLLIRQMLIGAHFAGIDSKPLQVVAGGIEAGQTPVAAAMRELQEEAGITCYEMVPAQNFLPSPGGSSERLHIFFAFADLSHAGGLHGLAEEHEDIKVEIMHIEEAIGRMDAGEIEAGPAVVALSWAARHYRDLRPEYDRMKSPEEIEHHFEMVSADYLIQTIDQLNKASTDPEVEFDPIHDFYIEIADSMDAGGEGGDIGHAAAALLALSERAMRVAATLPQDELKTLLGADSDEAPPDVPLRPALAYLGKEFDKRVKAAAPLIEERLDATSPSM